LINITGSTKGNTNHLTDFKKPFGRIHFAREHTSILRATIEGALQSGLRVTQEVDEQVEKR
jgi:monoamine oxidase